MKVASYDARFEPVDRRAPTTTAGKGRVLPLSGWGCAPVIPATVVRLDDLMASTVGATLSRGLGRSYGDSALPPAAEGIVSETTLGDRMLAFQQETGVLRAEAGLSLLELNRVFLSRGWFTPVSPGTQHVTLGGMVAADVHGKNHHIDGSFGGHVTRLLMRVASGEVVACSRGEEAELFRATIGGMGLTGHILEVEFRMKRIPSPWIWSEVERIPCLEVFLERLREAAQEWPYTVGWIDSLRQGKGMGRGVLNKGRWAQSDEAPPAAPRMPRTLTVPFRFPSWLLSRTSVRLFNAAYYASHNKCIRRRVTSPFPFFYPLDALKNWNLLYGRPGFTQYQCVLPHGEGDRPVRRFMKRLTALAGGSFLCVIKDYGAEGEGMLSFPRPGMSVAVDLPLRGGRTQTLVDRLNELVIEEGGRIYLAKDTLCRPEHFRAMEPRLAEWLRVRRRWDPQGTLRSAQSVRLFGDS